MIKFNKLHEKISPEIGLHLSLFQYSFVVEWCTALCAGFSLCLHLPQTPGNNLSTTHTSQSPSHNNDGNVVPDDFISKSMGLEVEGNWKRVGVVPTAKESFKNRGKHET
jgi:hypothetical protein